MKIALKLFFPPRPSVRARALTGLLLGVAAGASAMIVAMWLREQTDRRPDSRAGKPEKPTAAKTTEVPGANGTAVGHPAF